MGSKENWLKFFKLFFLAFGGFEFIFALMLSSMPGMFSVFFVMALILFVLGVLFGLLEKREINKNKAAVEISKKLKEEEIPFSNEIEKIKYLQGMAENYNVPYNFVSELYCAECARRKRAEKEILYKVEAEDLKWRNLYKKYLSRKYEKKYMGNLLEVWGKEVKNRDEFLSMGGKYASTLTHRRYAQHDSALIGGAVAGLTSPIIGLAAAISVENENQARAEAAKRRSENALNVSSLLVANSAQYSALGQEILYLINDMGLAVRKIDDERALISGLEINVIDKNITLTGCMDVAIELRDAPQWTNKHGEKVFERVQGDISQRLDGVLKIVAIENEKEIGYGYIATDGYFDKLDDCWGGGIGFIDKKKYSIRLFPVEGEKFTKNNDYQYKICDATLWYIDRAWMNDALEKIRKARLTYETTFLDFTAKILTL